METNPDFQTEPTRPLRKFTRKWRIGGGILIGLVIIGALIIFGRGQYLSQRGFRDNSDLELFR